MTTTLYDAFTGPFFDPVFAQASVAARANDAARMDVPELHADARNAVRQVASAAVSNPDPPMRICLIQGDAGFGKTHALIATLLDLARAGQAYPAIMQLSAKVEPEAVSLWMLRKIVDELGARHFRDEHGHTPLKRLANNLWKHAPSHLQNQFHEAVEVGDLSEALAQVTIAAPRIRRSLRDAGLSLKDEPFVAAILLSADDASYEFGAWLQGGTQPQRFGRYTLPALNSEMHRQEAILAIIRIASATDIPIIIAIDQIEAASRIGDQKLLGAVVASALQLVEETERGVGIVIAALADTYEMLIRDNIEDSYRQRIEFGRSPVKLVRPDKKTVRKVLDRRAAELLFRAGADAEPAASELIAPNWLIDKSQEVTLRAIFEEIRKYQSVCSTSGKFISENEYSPGDEPTGPLEDFDKLWEDARDADLGAVANFSDYDREQMFIWLADKAVVEIPNVRSVTAEAFQLQDADATRIIDVQFNGQHGDICERWKIAFADAPNQRGRLKEQIANSLDTASDAKPAVLRNGRLIGVNEFGKPDRPTPQLKKLQAGPALADFFDAGGRAASTAKHDWARLSLAKRFAEERQHAPGFDEWRQERRFLLEAAEIGQMTNLVQPEANALANTNGLDREVDSTGDADAEIDSDLKNDPRDLANIVIGRGVDGHTISWKLDKFATPALPNFGICVSGDAGQGKTQAIKSIVAESAKLNCPILIFDFKNDYADDPSDAFASDNGFVIIDLDRGLPFNPLKLPPHGPSGSQAINHVYEVAGVLGDTLKLGDQQKALLRSALENAYKAYHVPLYDWVDPAETSVPSLTDVVSAAESIDETRSQSLINRLGLLHGKRLMPSDAEAQMSFSDLTRSRTVLSFSSLPNDDQLKRALAELILIQLQGYMLRGDQPRALRRLLVFDEAWRAADSDRLIQLAREGRAFGVGIVAGSQFADDLSSELTGNLSTKLHLYNSDAGQRRKIVQATFGKVSGSQPNELMNTLSDLKKFEAVFINQQHNPYVRLIVTPYYIRKTGATIISSD